MGMLDNVMQKLGGSPAGLQGLTQKLTQGGLGQQVQSWIGHGDNHPVSGQQVTAALGENQVRQLADQAGVPPEEMSEKLARDLPQYVDQATPGGQLPRAPGTGDARGPSGR
jgi:uncharacterized protein YidB (DUF937 family)